MGESSPFPQLRKIIVRELRAELKKHSRRVTITNNQGFGNYIVQFKGEARAQFSIRSDVFEWGSWLGGHGSIDLSHEEFGFDDPKFDLERIARKMFMDITQHQHRQRQINDAVAE